MKNLHYILTIKIDYNTIYKKKYNHIIILFFYLFKHRKQINLYNKHNYCTSNHISIEFIKKDNLILTLLYFLN